MLEVGEGLVAEPSLVGEIAHMVAESQDGPRGVSPLTIAQRNSYPNLLLLCLEDHKLVDIILKNTRLKPCKA